MDAQSDAQLLRTYAESRSDAAFAESFARIAEASPVLRARIGWTYGFAVSLRRPDAARAAQEA